MTKSYKYKVKLQVLSLLDKFSYYGIKCYAHVQKTDAERLLWKLMDILLAIVWRDPCNFIKSLLKKWKKEIVISF